MIHNVDPQLTQWDVGRIVTISDSNATHIHFANQGDSKAVIIEIENGSAKIPDYLLQTGKTVTAYAVKDGVTLESKSFSVRKRERPENYVYEDDQRNYIYELITETENALESLGRAVKVADDAAENAGSAAGMAYEAAQSANLATTKANTATDNANLATKNANDATTKAVNAVKNMMVVGEAEGTSISLNNAIDQTLVGLRVFGKTTQNGRPTPDAPVELVNVGKGGITVNVTGENDAQSITIDTPNGLPGIPVTSGGNYTDANGQQWVCDEIDFAKGVYVQRIGVLTTEDLLNALFVLNNNTDNATFSQYIVHNAMSKPCAGSSSTIDPLKALCNVFPLGRQIYQGTVQESFWIYQEESLSFLLNKATCPDVKSAKEYILGHQLEIYYILKDPIETPLSEKEFAAYASLHTYKNSTTVSNDAGAYMELEYVMDAKKYIDSLVGTGGTILPARVE